jgi:hypothetical protein
MVTLQYSDFFLLTIVPIIIQAAAVVYLWKIHKFIGKEWTITFLAVNGILLLYDITISYLLLQPPDPSDVEEGIQGWGIFIGFVMPLANSILHFIMQKRLAKTFDYNKLTASLLERDTKRDTSRDTSRDANRDISRDSHRDVIRDAQKDREEQEEEEKKKDKK